MWQILILFSIFLPVKADLQAQELKPVTLREKSIAPISIGRTYNNYKGSRILASKKRTYPFLTQMEELLYPGMLFESENPGKRLERLEIAVFGSKQKGSINNRVSRIKSEVEAWQIANAQALEIVNSKTQASKEDRAFKYQSPRKNTFRQVAYTAPRQPVSFYQPQPPKYNYSTSVQATPYRRQIDYDYQNYRMASPLIRDIGRRTIDVLFSR